MSLYVLVTTGLHVNAGDFCTGRQRRDRDRDRDNAMYFDLPGGRLRRGGGNGANGKITAIARRIRVTDCRSVAPLLNHALQFAAFNQAEVVPP